MSYLLVHISFCNSCDTTKNWGKNLFKNCVIRFHTESSSIFGNANQTQLQPIDYKLFGYQQKYGKPVSKTNDKPAFAKKVRFSTVHADWIVEQWIAVSCNKS